MALRLPDRPTNFTAQSHKRAHHDVSTDSSDPPMFSSDPPVFQTSIEDYQRPSRKRQHKGPWYEMEREEDLHVKKTKGPLEFRGVRHKRRPLRKFDSGVYMGSDESLPSEFSETYSEHGMQCTTTNPEETPAAADNSLADLEPDQGQPQWQMDSDCLQDDFLLEKATQTIEDPGDFDGPVFPYWQQQPEGLRHFHSAQRMAQEKVLGCVERGEEMIDLSNFYLLQIRTPTLRPLRFHIRQDRYPSTTMPAKFERFTPSLTLVLSNNDLSAVPGELYHLKNLNILSLRSNNIRELLPAIGQLTSLKWLNIGSNQLFHLPFELLLLFQGALSDIALHPNPFIKPVPNPPTKAVLHSDREVSTWSLPPAEVRSEISQTSNEFYHLASTWPSFLDFTGKSMRQYPPSPNQLPSHHPKPTETITHMARPSMESQQKTPSLLETVLRNLFHVPELPQLPFHIPATESPHLHALLQRTYYLAESGGQKCTICGTGFVIPRVEWVEWWARKGKEPVPFLRRGCSWACSPPSDEKGVEKVGWQSSVEVEGRAIEVPDNERSEESEN